MQEARAMLRCVGDLGEEACLLVPSKARVVLRWATSS